MLRNDVRSLSLFGRLLPYLCIAPQQSSSCGNPACSGFILHTRIHIPPVRFHFTIGRRFNYILQRFMNFSCLLKGSCRAYLQEGDVIY